MKTCSCCKTEKPLSAYSPDVRTTLGVQSRCKICIAEAARMRRAKNPEPHREGVRKAVKRHYAKKLQRNRDYRAKNAEKVSAWKAADRTRNKARILADNAMRRAKLRDGGITPEVISVYALRDFYRAMSLGEDFHVDHIIPLSKGGAHAAQNLRVIPAIDNLRKGAA
jgi:5-methylcytosine-specific restriction endonuclease McrA